MTQCTALQFCNLYTFFKQKGTVLSSETYNTRTLVCVNCTHCSQQGCFPTQAPFCPTHLKLLINLFRYLALNNVQLLSPELRAKAAYLLIWQRET